MSRVHDALRRAGNSAALPNETPISGPAAPVSASGPAFESAAGDQQVVYPEMLEQVEEVPFRPAPESHLLDLHRTHETPAEEFRTLRTRLNHLQTLQPLHAIIVTSPSPAEGKTFTTVNLALAESHLPEQRVLLGDFDLRRPMVHTLFQIDRGPGLSDFLMGQVPLAQAMKKIADTNLWVLPAGSPVKNPLELLNARQAKNLFSQVASVFHWAIFDSPPLLFTADANLLSTMADGTILVVKIGTTTFDNVTRAMQSLCENNVLGIVANGARASELYSRYTYYYSKSE